jgi:hypothetical protein
MKVSVVISCYNEKDTIEKIVGAVGNAPLADREIIVEGTPICRLAPTATEISLGHLVAFQHAIFHSISAGDGIHRLGNFQAPTVSLRKDAYAFYDRRR